MVETDELIKEKLNRRERVMYLRDKNEGELVRSIGQLERSKSPAKKRF
jgi:hypothetical protein